MSGRKGSGKQAQNSWRDGSRRVSVSSSLKGKKGGLGPGQGLTPNAGRSRSMGNNPAPLQPNRWSRDQDGATATGWQATGWGQATGWQAPQWQGAWQADDTAQSSPAHELPGHRQVSLSRSRADDDDDQSWGNWTGALPSGSPAPNTPSDWAPAGDYLWSPATGWHWIGDLPGTSAASSEASSTPSEKRAQAEIENREFNAELARLQSYDPVTYPRDEQPTWHQVPGSIGQDTCPPLPEAPANRQQTQSNNP